jgi:flagellar basal-body rod protein FlgB
MIGRLDHLFDSHGEALKLRTFRQQLLASNIANADTPNYKAVDIDFASEMRRMMAGAAGSIQPTTTNPRHLAGGSGNPFGARLMYRTDVQGSIDGNTVNMDMERAQFAENALRYQASLNVLNTEIQHIKAALRTA